MTTRRRGRPRREGADEQILGVALEVLREKGYRDLTVDGIAERAGVAKTTVYRRWPSKGALVAAAIAPLAPVVSDDPDVVLGDISAILRLIATEDGETDTLEVVRAAVAPRRPVLREALVARNVPDADLVADFLIGFLLMRLFVTHEPVDEELSIRILRATTPPGS